MKPGIGHIIGKRIKHIVVSEQNAREPESQIFLVFDDDTYFEIYGDLRVAGGVDCGGLESAVNYAKKFGGMISQY